MIFDRVLHRWVDRRQAVNPEHGSAVSPPRHTDQRLTSRPRSCRLLKLKAPDLAQTSLVARYLSRNAHLVVTIAEMVHHAVGNRRKHRAALEQVACASTRKSLRADLRLLGRRIEAVDAHESLIAASPAY